VTVAVAVIMIVIAPVMVAALVNGNDTVIAIDTVDDQGSINVVSIATMRSSNSTPRVWSSVSINSSTRIPSRREADLIAAPLAIVYCLALSARVVRPQPSAMFCGADWAARRN
jgi:hypothetical protein